MYCEPQGLLSWATVGFHQPGDESQLEQQYTAIHKIFIIDIPIASK